MRDSQIDARAAASGRAWARRKAAMRRWPFASESALIRALARAAALQWRAFERRSGAEPWWRERFIEVFEGAAMRWLDKEAA